MQHFTQTHLLVGPFSVNLTIWMPRVGHAGQFCCGVGGRKSCEAAGCIAPLHGKGMDSQMGRAGRSQGVHREKGPLALMKPEEAGAQDERLALSQ